MGCLSDDGTFPHQISDNTKGLPDMQSMTAIVARVFYAHALLPNFKKGKSEWMLVLRGTAAVAVRHIIFVVMQAVISCQVYHNHYVSAHVVPHYKHLGNHCTPSLSPTHMSNTE